jgi:hypothetical protein
MTFVQPEAQPDPAGDECFKLLRGEGSERRRGRPDYGVFLAQIIELIYPCVACLCGLI